MAKWADYLISEVRYDSKKDHIIRVKSHEDKDTSVGSAFEETRSSVVDKLKIGNTYCTIVKASGKWSRGSDLHVVKVGGTEYIRTDKNQTAKDNLGNLPEF